MTTQTKHELAGLSDEAKAELVSMIANKMTIIAGNAQLIATGTIDPRERRHRANMIDRDARRLVDEVKELLEVSK